ncbi:MAG TPA: type II toxin-antitoxin system VapC family toxin [bacterium]|mgnify:CR=1 FL=1|nr:type II toxin-antitoxin system VapC family toxin [bacterium]HQL62737.1 type II toxin-antitoxin system VapC family toxin [bacterium]
MILVDVNILLYAQDELSPCHTKAREWLDSRLSGDSPVCFCWPVLGAFIRISTNPRIFKHPLSLNQALSCVQSWLDQPCTRIVHPTSRHWTVFRKMLVEGQAVANLVTDAHLATLAIEHGCELMSTDTDFSRFPAVKWRNPLK